MQSVEIFPLMRGIDFLLERLPYSVCWARERNQAKVRISVHIRPIKAIDIRIRMPISLSSISKVHRIIHAGSCDDHRVLELRIDGSCLVVLNCRVIANQVAVPIVDADPTLFGAVSVNGISKLTDGANAGAYRTIGTDFFVVALGKTGEVERVGEVIDVVVSLRKGH